MFNDYFDFKIATTYIPAIIYDDYSGLMQEEIRAIEGFISEYNQLKNATWVVDDYEANYAIDEISDMDADCITLRVYFTNESART